MSTFFKNIFIGILIGSGAIIPGISSGVILVSFGLYEKLLSSILYFLKDIKKNLNLLIPIVIGAFIGIVLLGNFLNLLYVSFASITKFCFIGLILGTVPSVLKIANKNVKYFKFSNFLFAIVSFAIVVFMILIEKNMTSSKFATSQFSYLYLIISGFFMSAGVIIPRYK